MSNYKQGWVLNTAFWEEKFLDEDLKIHMTKVIEKSAYDLLLNKVEELENEISEMKEQAFDRMVERDIGEQ